MEHSREQTLEVAGRYSGDSREVLGRYRGGSGQDAKVRGGGVGVATARIVPACLRAMDSSTKRRNEESDGGCWLVELLGYWHLAVGLVGLLGY